MALATALDVHARLDHGRAVGLQHALGHALGHRRHGIADVDLAAGDVVGAAVERGRLGEAGDGVLGRGVGDRERPRRMGRDRAVVDDAPAARLLVLHDLHGFLGAQERAGEVGRHHAEPGLVGQLLQRHRRRAAAGIVEHQVEPAPGRLDLGEQRHDVVALGDVGRHGERVGRVVAGQLGGLVQRVLAAAGQRHLVAVVQQSERRGAADAAACAGDDCDLSAHGFVPPRRNGP